MPDIPSFSIPEPQPFDDLLSLSGRVVVVTGGTRGIGGAVVRRLAQAGASLIVTARQHRTQRNRSGYRRNRRYGMPPVSRMGRG